MLQQIIQIVSPAIAFSSESQLGPKQMTIHRVFIVICLCGLLLTPFGSVKAQGLVEYALILVTVQQVDVNGDGRLERVEGNFQLYADNTAEGYLSIQGADGESHLTVRNGNLWCNGGAPALDFSGSLRVHQDDWEETFEQISITVRPSGTVSSLWIANLGEHYGPDQPIAFAAMDERELRVDPCAAR